MEHNYEVKTSNRVLTVATGAMGEKQKIFYRLGVFFFCYISGHRAGREWTRVDQGARLRDVLNITLQSSLPWLLSQSPSLASLFSQLPGSDKFFTGTPSLRPQKKGFWMLTLHHSVFFIMFSYSSTTGCVFTFFSKQHKSRLKG